MNNPQRASALSSMMEGLSLPQPPRISIKDQRFSLIDAAGNRMMCNLVDQSIGFYIDVVIIHANPNRSKIMYDPTKPYRDDSNDPPICWSDNGIAPSVVATTPQARTCTECEWNRIGSAQSKKSGAAIKACQDRKKLAVFVVGDPAGSMYQLQITPNALRNLSAYGKWVSKHPSPSGQGSADVRELVTRVYFEEGQQGTLTFGAVGPVDQLLTQRVGQALNGSELDEIIGLDDTPILALPAPAPVQQIAPPGQTWQPAPQQPAGFQAPGQQPPTQWQAPPAQQFQQPQGAQQQGHQPPQGQWQPTIATPVQQPAQPNAPQNQAPPGMEWSAVAQRWIPVNAQGAPTGGPTYPAPPPGVEHPGVPNFLRHPQNPVPGQQPQGQQPAAQQFPQQAPQGQAFSQPAPVAGPTPATGKGSGRGGKRPGAGRRVAETVPAGTPPQQGQAFGAPQGQPQQFQQPQGGQAPFAQQPAQNQGPPPAAQFGMQPGATPSADLNAALDRAFDVQIPGR